MEILFLLVYGVVLGLVAPYISLNSENYGILVPGALSIVWGGLLWTILTWVGLSSDQAYIWVAVMLSMPAAMWVGSKRLNQLRSN